MIAKHIPMKVAQKSSFSRLGQYVTDPQDKHERVGTVHLTNCVSDQVELAILEILNIQAQNTRSTADKTYHLMVSFRTGEQPDEATLKAIEERICNGLGFTGHQRMSAVHHDTDNLHIHIAINKIHPTRYTIHEPYNAYHTLAKLCGKLEHEYGLEKDNHTPKKSRSENRAEDMERHADVESLLGWLKRECKTQMQGAQSWDSLHEVMRQNGLHIHQRANGLVITADNGVSVKASSVSREFSKASLEQRYGAFQPPPEHLAAVKPARRYEKKPLASKVDTAELYGRYKSEQEHAATNRAAEWDKAKARKDRLIEDAKRNGRLKRAAIKLFGNSRIAKKLMYSATSKTLRDEINTINQQYLKERDEIYARYQRRAWADWLRDQAAAGDQEALQALRGRKAATGLKGDTVAGKGGARGTGGKSRQDSITKKGTIIYSDGKSAVRDDGDKLKVSRGADQAGLETALRLAMERYGNRITVNGSAAFKERIARAAAAANLPVTFDDEALEQRRQQLTNPSTTKEKQHGIDSRRGPDSGRTGQGRHAAAARTAAAARAGAAKPGPGHSVRHKPDLGKPAKAAPPAARNGVRNLSEFGVVQQPEGGQVLLPGHVPGGVEHQGAQSDHGLRRPVHRPGRVGPAPAGAGKPDVARPGAARPPVSKAHQQRPSQAGAASTGNGPAAAAPAAVATKPKVKRVGSAPSPASKDRLRPLSQLGAVSIGDHQAPAAPAAPAQPTVPTLRTPATQPLADQLAAEPGKRAGLAAAAKYIAEREQKRALGFDIPKHISYTEGNDRAAVYAGIRQVDGQALALLKHGDEVQVLPVDEATARRLKRVPVGSQVGVTSKGAIKTKGRSR